MTGWTKKNVLSNRLLKLVWFWVLCFSSPKRNYTDVKGEKEGKGNGGRATSVSLKLKLKMVCLSRHSLMYDRGKKKLKKYEKAQAQPATLPYLNSYPMSPTICTARVWPMPCATTSIAEFLYSMALMIWVNILRSCRLVKRSRSILKSVSAVIGDEEREGAGKRGVCGGDA